MKMLAGQVKIVLAQLASRKKTSLLSPGNHPEHLNHHIVIFKRQTNKKHSKHHNLRMH